jgi:predicted protein tyrosine phosphatase
MFNFTVRGWGEAGAILDGYGPSASTHVLHLKNGLFDIPTPTRALSLMSPGAEFASRGENHLVLRFEDVSSPTPNAPTMEHVLEGLAFCADLTDDDFLLINCHAGQSRSTAMAIGVLILHGMDPQSAFDAVKADRPVLMPNMLITQHLDQHFKLDGKLNQIVIDFVRAELGAIRVPQTVAPTTDSINEMQRLMDLF